MSTSYYHLRQPITSLRLEEVVGHDRLTLFESGANIGTLTLSKGMGKTVASFFADEVDDHVAPLRTHYGGKGVGCVVTVHDPHLHPETMLIDEYGQPFTVAQIRAMNGNGA